MFDLNNASSVIEKNITNDLLDKLKGHFIAVDTETTGLNPNYDSLLEIGACEFLNGKVVSKFQTFVNPLFPIPPYTTFINHITDSMVCGAPLESEAIKLFLNYIKDAAYGNTYLVAHNASFDSRFLLTAFNNANINCNLLFVDTLKLVREFYPNLSRHDLEYLQRYFNVTNSNQHRAYEDALSCGEILLKMMKKIEIETSQNFNLAKPCIPKGNLLTTYALFLKLLKDNNLDISNVGCKMNGKDFNGQDIMTITNGLVINNIVKLKKNSKYFACITFRNDIADIKSENEFKDIYQIENCDNCKVYYIGLKQYSDLYKYSKYIIKSYNDAFNKLNDPKMDFSNKHIIDLNECKKINKDDLDLYLPDGGKFHYM